MARRKWRVVWTEAATEDLVEIVSFAARTSPSSARRLLLGLRSKAHSLERSPQRGRVVPELASAGTRAWRELIVKPHRIVYRVRRDVVLVGAIVDGRRDLEDLLLERLTRSVESLDDLDDRGLLEPRAHEPGEALDHVRRRRTRDRS